MRARTYRANDPAFSARYDGFVLGEGAGVLGGDLAFESASRRSPVGTYDVVPGGLTARNYGSPTGPAT